MTSQHQEKLMRIFRTAIIFLYILISVSSAADYDGYKVYQLSPQTSEQIAILKSLDGVTGYDFWYGAPGNTSKLMVSPEEQPRFEALMALKEIEIIIFIEDVGARVRRNLMTHGKESARRSNLPTDWRKFSFDKYLRFEDMWLFTKAMVSGNPKAKFFVFGTTSQGRKMFGVKLSTSDNNPVILIDGGIHAREWSAPMSVLYILQRLVDDEELLKHITFYIIPNVNPDGYEHTQVDRYWRKTMSIQPFTKCLGVDANRNFDSHWSEIGADTAPCSGTYSGPYAFSEPESRALRDLIKAVKPVMYLTFHNFGGLILYPWGFTKKLPRNWQELDSLGEKAAAEIGKLFNSTYTVGSSTNVLYSASGGSDDWAMEKAGVPLVYCIELEDYGSQFDLPAEKLGEIVRHADVILRVFVKHVRDKYGA